VSRFGAAANNFRIPYWDWGLGEGAGALPDFFTQPNLEVIGFDGKPMIVNNPLNQYPFHPLVPGDFDSKVSFSAELVDFADSLAVVHKPRHNYTPPD
jgi:tyrosinase